MKEIELIRGEKKKKRNRNQFHRKPGGPFLNRPKQTEQPARHPQSIRQKKQFEPATYVITEI